MKKTNYCRLFLRHMRVVGLYKRHKSIGYNACLVTRGMPMASVPGGGCSKLHAGSHCVGTLSKPFTHNWSPLLLTCLLFVVYSMNDYRVPGSFALLLNYGMRAISNTIVLHYRGRSLSWDNRWLCIGNLSKSNNNNSNQDSNSIIAQLSPRKGFSVHSTAEPD